MDDDYEELGREDLDGSYEVRTARLDSVVLTGWGFGWVMVVL